MSSKALSEIIGVAILDMDFRRALLADPALAVAAFDLTPGERDALARCRTGSLVEFAAAMHDWLTATDGSGERCPPRQETGFWSQT
jgi:hypothetical protein